MEAIFSNDANEELKEPELEFVQQNPVLRNHLQQNGRLSKWVRHRQCQRYQLSNIKFKRNGTGQKTFKMVDESKLAWLPQMQDDVDVKLDERIMQPISEKENDYATDEEQINKLRVGMLHDVTGAIYSARTTETLKRQLNDDDRKLALGLSFKYIVSYTHIMELDAIGYAYYNYLTFLQNRTEYEDKLLYKMQTMQCAAIIDLWEEVPPIHMAELPLKVAVGLGCNHELPWRNLLKFWSDVKQAFGLQYSDLRLDWVATFLGLERFSTPERVQEFLQAMGDGKFNDEYYINAFNTAVANENEFIQQNQQLQQQQQISEQQQQSPVQEQQHEEQDQEQEQILVFDNQMNQIVQSQDLSDSELEASESIDFNIPQSPRTRLERARSAYQLTRHVYHSARNALRQEVIALGSVVDDYVFDFSDATQGNNTDEQTQ